MGIYLIIHTPDLTYHCLIIDVALGQIRKEHAHSFKGKGIKKDFLVVSQK